MTVDKPTGKMTMCSKDFYRDEESGKCQSCAELCHQAEVRGTVDPCSRLCPVSLHDPVTETQTGVSTTIASAAGTMPLSLNNDGYLMPEVLVITLGVGIILVALAGFVILFYQRSWRRTDRSSKRPGKDPGTYGYTVSSISATFLAKSY
ncbi:uncharacterized protein LOC124259298 isoform X2 [Haliotis rubra]|uniref:uncharacterized protein LOC124259298 isoform X2 n=1 Tax=Haliotis rubra TaxID=36100 RepID=UPI001EE57683|nr:uncharacterized protein LOC124259298 isoform X2 [Haliotis rubra]